MCVRNRSKGNSLEGLVVTQDIYLKVYTKNGSNAAMTNRMWEIFYCFFFVCFWLGLALPYCQKYKNNCTQLCSTWSSNLQLSSLGLFSWYRQVSKKEIRECKSSWIGVRVTSTAFCWLSKSQGQTGVLDSGSWADKT